MDVVAVFGFPFLVAICAIAYAAFRQYLKHKERMAMIEKGLVPPDWEQGDGAGADSQIGQASPITVTLVGVAITLGLLTLGVGPWLIAGLVPTAIGCAMLIQQMLKESKNKEGKEQ